MSLANYTLSDQDINTSATKQGSETYGQVESTTDGRVFAYGVNASSSTALNPGQLTQGAVAVANHQNQTGVIYPTGTNQISFAIGATAATAAQYQDGYFFVNTSTGAGQTSRILNNLSATSSGTLTIKLKDTLTQATTAVGSKFSVQPNPFNGINIANQASATAVIPTGVPAVSIAASNWGWFQIGGPCATLINGTPAVGVGVIPSATTSGAVDVATGSITQPFVGYMLVAGVSTQYYPVFLTMNQC